MSSRASGAQRERILGCMEKLRRFTICRKAGLNAEPPLRCTNVAPASLGCIFNSARVDSSQQNEDRGLQLAMLGSAGAFRA